VSIPVCLCRPGLLYALLDRTSIGTPPSGLTTLIPRNLRIVRRCAWLGEQIRGGPSPLMLLHSRPCGLDGQTLG
jgi:hypothetical protein